MEALPVTFGVVFPQPTRQRNSAGPAAAPPNSWYVGAGSGVGATPAENLMPFAAAPASGEAQY